MTRRTVKQAGADVFGQLQRNSGAILLIFALAYMLSQLVGWQRDQSEARRPFTDYVAYQSVRFVAADPALEALQMVSTVTWFERVDRIIWSDRLRCQAPTIGDDAAPQDWPIWSTQELSASNYFPAGATVGELEPRPWTFVGDPGPGTNRPRYPTDGRTCVMISVVTVENGGHTDVALVESPPFRPGA